MRSRNLQGAAIVLTALILSAGGCSALAPSQTKVQKRQEAAEKALRVGQLYDDILARVIQVGMSQDDIKSRYGEPEDMFRSSSSVSSMEIWTYERTPAGQYDAFQAPIRLYFQDQKLLQWNY